MPSVHAPAPGGDLVNAHEANLEQIFIGELDITQRTFNSLQRAGIENLAQLTSDCGWCLLAELRNFGVTSLDTLAAELAHRGLHFSTCDDHDGKISED